MTCSTPAVIRLPEYFVFQHYTDFNQARDQAVALGSTSKQISLDFTHVKFIDSAALGMLLQLHHQVSTSGIKLNIRGAEGNVLDMLHLTKMDRYFSILAKH
jgi:anti-anti-sigma factor